MDSAYDAQHIRETCQGYGHVAIIDKNACGQKLKPMVPHEAERYKMRSSAEQANTRLEDGFGAENLMVKGHTKVTLHLMLGVIVLFTDQLIRLLG